MVKDCGSHLLSRRSFLRGTSRFAIASAIASNSLGVAGLMRASQSMATTEGYKALVFVFLNGGNDSFNTFAPLGSSALRNNYVTNRGVLGLSQSELIELNIQNSVRVFGELESSSFGIHPECGHLAEMFNNRELAVMCNIGNLVAPVTRDQYMGNTTQSVSLPPKLFSHSDQQRQFQSEPTSRYSYGWGGRLAELLTSYNTNPCLLYTSDAADE